MLSAYSDSGMNAVDWWFMYKLPKGCGPKKSPAAGKEYLYFEQDQTKPLYLSSHQLGEGKSGALYNTLQQLLNNPSPHVGWIHYNDEYPSSIKKTDFPPQVPAKYHGPNAGASFRGKPVNHDYNGHCKGTLAFDLENDTAFWLSHSTPRIPDLHGENDDEFFYPDYAAQYAQTFICISLQGVSTAQQIAQVLQTQHQPQVFGCQLPAAVTQTSEYADLWQLAQGSRPPTYNKKYIEKHGRKTPADLTFTSKGGKNFRLLAKSGAWFDDFWIDLVGPKLGVDLRIETWRRLTKTAVLPTKDHQTITSDYGSNDFVTDYKGKEYHHEFVDLDNQDIIDEVTNINLKNLVDHKGTPLIPYQWSYTKDHAKWAISEDHCERGKTEDGPISQQAVVNSPDEKTPLHWVCIADMNRMTSQEKRGGGAICFHEPRLWQSLNEIEEIKGDIT